ncbi:MAG: hypothetical protein NUV80_05450 [Candidatus Berkelbacteria bacterium]|nr:hypothetical protein [Candidatus Berkelbacteria bacterium]MCR4307981.1 hypothetical protein [Candidatus Berkelbacteria bacterium]
MNLTVITEPRQGQVNSSAKTSASKSIELLRKLGRMFDYQHYSTCQESIGAIERLLNRGDAKGAAATGFELVRQRRQDALPSYLEAIKDEIEELEDVGDFKSQFVDAQLEMGRNGDRGFDAGFRSLMKLRSCVYDARRAQAPKPRYDSSPVVSTESIYERDRRLAIKRAKAARHQANRQARGDRDRALKLKAGK